MQKKFNLRGIAVSRTSYCSVPRPPLIYCSFFLLIFSMATRFNIFTEHFPTEILLLQWRKLPPFTHSTAYPISPHPAAYGHAIYVCAFPWDRRRRRAVCVA